MIVSRRALALVLPVLAACRKSEPPDRHLPVRGVVLKIDPAAKSINFDAEKIEGWMEAMAMDYPVSNPADLKTLKPGDKITATVDIHGLDYSLSNIHLSR